MKPASAIGVRFSWSAAALGCLLLPLPAFSQATHEPSTSEVISPKSESKSVGSIEPRKPSITEDSDDNTIAVDPSTLLPDLPPLPKQNATLVGGTLERVDLVRDKVTVRLFGGGQESFLFDTRTQVFRGGKPATVADLHEGERIYLDTILDGSDQFARTMRLNAAHATGTSQGVVVKFRSNRSQLILRDALSPNPVEVRLSPSTRISEAGRSVSLIALVPGSLIRLSFSSAPGAGNTATEISILAQPGIRYTFSGQLLHIDLRTGLLVLNSSTDGKTYEVYLASGTNPDENLRPGAKVTLTAEFDGQRYVVRNIRFKSE